MRSGALVAQAETSNINATGSKCSAEVKFKTWSQRQLNLLATVMRSGALVAQAEISNITTSGIWVLPTKDGWMRELNNIQFLSIGVLSQRSFLSEMFVVCKFALHGQQFSCQTARGIE